MAEIDEVAGGESGSGFAQRLMIPRKPFHTLPLRSEASFLMEVLSYKRYR